MSIYRRRSVIATIHAISVVSCVDLSTPKLLRLLRARSLPAKRDYGTHHRNSSLHRHTADWTSQGSTFNGRQWTKFTTPDTRKLRAPEFMQRGPHRHSNNDTGFAGADIWRSCQFLHEKRFTLLAHALFCIMRTAA